MLLGGLAACACCPPSPPVAVAADWNYNCPGPAGWGGTCRSTLSQSPVDIALPSGVAPEQLSSPYGLLRFDYPAVTRKATVVNTGHGTPQVHPGEGGGMPAAPAAVHRHAPPACALAPCGQCAPAWTARPAHQGSQTPAPHPGPATSGQPAGRRDSVAGGPALPAGAVPLPLPQRAHHWGPARGGGGAPGAQTLGDRWAAGAACTAPAGAALARWRSVVVSPCSRAPGCLLEEAQTWASHALLHAARPPPAGELLVLGALLQPEAEQAHPGLQAALEAVPARAGYEAPLDSPISLLSLLPPPRGDDGRRPYATYAGERTLAAAHACLPGASKQTCRACATWASGCNSCEFVPCLVHKFCPAGSLTTPPCSEGVRWVVFLEPVRVQASQVLDLMMFCGGGANMGLNARPVQPLEGRQLQFFV